VCGGEHNDTKKKDNKEKWSCVSLHGLGKTARFRWWYLSDVVAAARVPCTVMDGRTECRCDVACRRVVVDERDKGMVGDGCFGNGCSTGPRQTTSLTLLILVF
jgi:hypothetical protein